MGCREDTFQIRIDAAREAQQRSRVALLVLTVLSLAFLISEYNVVFSWSRGFANKATLPAAPSIAGKLQEQTLAEWVKRQVVSISLLGIQIGSDDLQILGPLTLFLVSIWFLFCLRQEFTTIVLLLRDARVESEDTRWYVYYGIVSAALFVDLNEYGQRGREKQELQERVRGLIFPYNIAFRFLVFFPLIAVVLAIGFDLSEVFLLPAVFRDPSKTLWSAMSHSECAEVMSYYVVDAFLVPLTVFGCWQASLLIGAVETALKRFRRESLP